MSRSIDPIRKGLVVDAAVGCLLMRRLSYGMMGLTGSWAAGGTGVRHGAARQGNTADRGDDNESTSGAESAHIDRPVC